MLNKFFSICAVGGKRLSAALFFSAFAVAAQGSGGEPFKGKFVNKANNVTLCLDAYGESLDVPGFDFLGATNGYMSGSIYGTWIVTRAAVSGNEATVHLSNEFGSEALTVTLRQMSDTLFAYTALGPSDIKKVVGRKLVKIPTKMDFVKTGK